MKIIKTLLAALLIGAAGYQQTQAVPTLHFDFTQDNWIVHFTYGVTDLPATTETHTYYVDGLDLDTRLDSGQNPQGHLDFIIGDSAITAVGEHFPTLEYTDGGVTFTLTAPSYTVATPTGDRPTHITAPDGGLSFGMLGAAAIVLFSARSRSMLQL